MADAGAGAGRLVRRYATPFNYSLPPIIKSNITPPSIRSGKETLYFLPDFTLVVRYAWKYPNRNGGPDRRFSNNYEIPVCEYESIYLISPNELNEMLEVSYPGSAEPFADALAKPAHANGSQIKLRALPKTG